MDKNDYLARWQTMLAQARRFADQDAYLDALARARAVEREALQNGAGAQAEAARECAEEFERLAARDRSRIVARREAMRKRDVADQLAE